MGAGSRVSANCTVFIGPSAACSGFFLDFFGCLLGFCFAFLGSFLLGFFGAHGAAGLATSAAA